MDTSGDINESNITVFHDGAKDMECILYTTKKSVRDSCVKRNPPIRETSDSHGFMLYYSRDQLRTPVQWLKVKGKEESED